MLYCYSFWFSKGFLHFFILDFSPFYSIYLALLYTLASMRDWTTFCLVRSCSHAFPSRVCSVSGLGLYRNLQSSHLNLHTQQLHSSYSFQVIPWRARATLESGRALTATFLTFLSWWNWMFDFGAIIIILWSDGFLFLSLSCLSDGRVVGGWKRVAMFMIKFSGVDVSRVAREQICMREPSESSTLPISVLLKYLFMICCSLCVNLQHKYNKQSL